ncbi:uncharacterized protein LOC128394996 [Panonychus citri]|uniref:uncharacterized protein LOC128394996 n=1 Tax=Panonychus citri TaxID=50023 RepID=UPI0023080140|nr:uncharacterized protein LOC128394996 [Panonychus citri]
MGLNIRQFVGKLISFIIYSTLLHTDLIVAIKLRRFGVPGAVSNGSSVWLHCDYDLEGDSLYSVKWYKNYEEFYGYLPLNSHSEVEHKTYYQRGINIDLLRSNATHVHLDWTDLNTEGTFGCEVSTEAPVFRTVKAEKDLRIYVAPISELKINGIEERYNIEDTVTLTCIGGPSKPPMILSWSINHKQVYPSLDFHISINTSQDFDGLSLSTSTLTFPLKSTLISTGDLIISCEALFTTINGVTYKELIIEEKSSSSSSSSDNDEHDSYSSSSSSSSHHHHHNHHLHSLDTDYPVTSESYIDSNEESQFLRSPTINGYSHIYSIGTILQVNCSTEPFYPPAYLEWYINDKEASREELVYFNHNQPVIRYDPSSTNYADLFGDTSAKSSQLGLQLKITKEHYQTSDGFLRVRCKATYIKIIKRVKSQLTISNDGKHSSQLYASHPVLSGCLMINGPSLLIVILIMIPLDFFT